MSEIRQVLVLVHCQEANRDRIDEHFINTLVQGIRQRHFAEIIHLSATSIWGAKDSPIFDEIREAVDRCVTWDFCEFRPEGPSVDITPKEIDDVFDEKYSYHEAGLERMEQAQWIIPLEDRRTVLSLWGRKFTIYWEDQNYPRQFAYIPEIFRNPLDWKNNSVVLGGLFGDQCVNDVRQILAWMKIKREDDNTFVGFSVD